MCLFTLAAQNSLDCEVAKLHWNFSKSIRKPFASYLIEPARHTNHILSINCYLKKNGNKWKRERKPILWLHCQFWSLNLNPTFESDFFEEEILTIDFSSQYTDQMISWKKVKKAIIIDASPLDWNKFGRTFKINQYNWGFKT